MAILNSACDFIKHPTPFVCLYNLFLITKQIDTCWMNIVILKKKYVSRISQILMFALALEKRFLNNLFIFNYWCLYGGRILRSEFFQQWSAKYLKGLPQTRFRHYKRWSYALLIVKLCPSFNSWSPSTLLRLRNIIMLYEAAEEALKIFSFNFNIISSHMKCKMHVISF